MSNTLYFQIYNELQNINNNVCFIYNRCVSANAFQVQKVGSTKSQLNIDSIG